jgi:hypothetical protein
MSNAEAVASRLETDRKALLDLSLRNPLLNYRPRARRLDIIGELPTQVYRSLASERKRMAFLPAPEPAEDVGEARESVTKPQTVQDDLKLQTELPADALQPRLLSIYYAARTSRKRPLAAAPRSAASGSRDAGTIERTRSLPASIERRRHRDEPLAV